MSNGRESLQSTVTWLLSYKWTKRGSAVSSWLASEGIVGDRLATFHIDISKLHTATLLAGSFESSETVSRPSHSPGRICAVVTLPWSLCVSSQQQLCQHQQLTRRLPASPVCRELEVIFQLAFYISAALYISCWRRLTDILCIHGLLQKNQLSLMKTYCRGSNGYICYINAFDNSSLFLGLLGQINADSRQSGSLEELGGIVFIKWWAGWM